MPGRERDIRLHVKTDSDNRGLVKAANDLEKLSRGADVAGGNFRDFTSDTKRLSVEIDRTTQRIRELQLQIAKTGDEGLFGDLRKEERRLRNLEHVLVSLGGEAGVQGGRLFLAGFVDSVGALPSQLRGAFIVGIAGVAAAAAPVLGAAVAGAVTGLVGTGGIIGGIAQASKDPRVRAAAGHFGEEISKEFFTTGGAFVEPIIKSLGILEKAFKDLDLGDAFAKVAPFVDDLAQAFGDMARNIMPGLNEAFDNLGPIIAVIAKELPELGAAFGDMLADMSESEGAAEGLHAAFEFLEATLRVAGDTISFLGDRFHELIGFLAKVGPPIEKLLSAAGHVNPLFAAAADAVHSANKEIAEIAAGTGPASDGLDTMGSSTSKTEDAAKKLKDELDKANKEIAETARVAFQGENATLRFEEGLDRLRESVKNGNRQLGVFNDEGRENRRTLQDIVQAAYDARDAIISEGGGTEEARRRGDKAFNGMIAKARETANNLKLPKGAVDGLIGSLNRVPRNTVAKVSTPGAARSRIQVLDLREAIRDLHGKTITINTKFRYGPKPIPLQHGGLALAGHPYVVGEKRPELFVPDRNGRIEPKVPTRTAQRAGGNTYNINVSAGLADPRLVATQVIEAIQHYQKRNGTGWMTA